MAYTQTHTVDLEPVDLEQSTTDDAQARGERHRARGGCLPAIGLFFLAPLVGEFLLGNLPITWLWALVSLAPLYGGGALLIRETARRFGLGWPGMVVLGLTYAVIEEAFVTQSLFNPDYVGLRLLDYGYISSLGISAWWTVFVLGIHTIWSTAVPIALIESLMPERSRTPWLGRWALAAVALVFVIGCAMSFIFQMQSAPFMASTMQFIVSGVVVLLLIGAAVLLGRMHVTARSGQEPPSVFMTGAVTFVLGSAFMGVVNAPQTMPAAFPVVGMLALLIGGGLLLWNWSTRTGWSELHRFAAAAGLLLVYAWYGFIQVPSIGGTDPTVDAIGNAVFAAAALLLLVVTWRRLSTRSGQVA